MASSKPKKITPRCGHGSIWLVDREKPYRATIMVQGQRLSETFISEEDAQTWLDQQAKRSIKYGISLDKSKMTWGEVSQMFIESKELSGLKKTTLQDYRQCLKYCSIWDKTPIQHITAEHITKLLAQLRKKPLAPKTLRNHYATIKAILKFALGLDIVDRVVADRIKSPVVKESVPKVLSECELRSFFKAIEGDRLEAFFWVVVSCGLRKGEAIGLKWSDIDLETGSTTIKRRIARLKGLVDIDTPKSRAGMRVVQLPKKALEKLLVWKKIQELDKKLHEGFKDEDWVFTHTTGKWIEPRFVNKKLSELLARAGLEHVTVHELRHTFCTLLLSKGVPVKDVQEIAGHSRPSVTLNMYYTSIPGASSRVSAKLDELLG